MMCTHEHEGCPVIRMRPTVAHFADCLLLSRGTTNAPAPSRIEIADGLRRPRIMSIPEAQRERIRASLENTASQSAELVACTDRVHRRSAAAQRLQLHG